ncbi:MAG TPA: hypothetical protein VIQ31_16010, partial [Phormidium sp.]
MVDRKRLKKPAAKGGAKSKARTTRSSQKNVDDDESDFESDFVELEIEEFEEVKSEGQQQNTQRLRERGNRVTRQQKAQEELAITALPVNKKENVLASVTASSLYNEPVLEEDTMNTLSQDEKLRLLFSLSPTEPFAEFMALFQLYLETEDFSTVEMEQFKYVQYASYLILIPLFYLRRFLKKPLAKYMSECLCIARKDVLKFDNTVLKTWLQFHVAFYQGLTATQSLSSNESGKAQHNKFKRAIFVLIKAQFQRFRKDEEDSIYKSLAQGEVFVIFGFHQKTQARHIIGCVLFSSNVEGIYINWLVISGNNFDVRSFGSTANNQAFRSCGLGTLLLLLVQARSAALGWSTDMFLQTNQGQVSVQFYEQLGFQKTSSNSLDEMPQGWKNNPSFYVKFIPDAINAIDTKAENWLHLYRSNLFILSSLSSATQTAPEALPLLPADPQASMFTFPLDVMGYKLD